MTGLVWARFGSSVLMCATALAAGACIPASNPCDPSADPAIQAEGTRVSGAVADTDGNPLGGVVVSIAGRAETVVSATDGSFAFTNLPPAPSYELVALAQPPAVGGRTRTDALVCKGAIDNVELLVVVPPPSPEVEIVKASGDRRLFVAFAGILPLTEDIGDDGAGMYGTESTAEADPAITSEDVMMLCKEGIVHAHVTFRVQLRTPFGAWQDAVVTPFPWSEAPPDGSTGDGAMTQGELEDSTLFTDRLDDFCAAALCTQFRYLDDSLNDEQARCAEVVGVVEDNGESEASVAPLEPYASYHVRVLAERNTSAELQERAALPARVEGALASRTGQMSLVPAALLPVADSDGSLLDPRGEEVLAVVPTAGGRFAIVSTDEVIVVGDGADAMAADARATFTGPYLALSRDLATSERLTTELYDVGAVSLAVGLEPAGAWARVVGPDGLGGSRVEKLYVGADSASGTAGATPIQAAANALHPSIPFDIADGPLGAPIAFSYLLRDATPLDQAGVQIPDAYLVVYPHTFVLSEQRQNPLDGAADLTLATLTSPATDVTGWADAANADAATGFGTNAAAGGGCAALAVEMNGTSLYGGMEEPDGDGGLINSTRAAACYDVGAALGETVALSDHEVLPVSDGVDGTDDKLLTFHLLTDAENDRVLAVSTADLVCANCDGASVPLATRLRDDAIPVGRDPGGMSRSLILDCSSGVQTDTPVVLVANRKGGDVSVLAQVDGRVQEMAVVPVPANVVEFLDDGKGPTCDDPFAWAVAEDGRLFPIDMRGSPSMPLCDDRPCEVGTRGRGVAGAIGRGGQGPDGNRARVVVGGPGLVGEVGFFAPKAPMGDAYTGRADMSEEGLRDAP